MFHACVQRFDGMNEFFLFGKLNRPKNVFNFRIKGVQVTQFTKDRTKLVAN